MCVCVCSLRLFQNFESFRVLVCGGDGSVSWVLNEIDRLGLQKQVHCTDSLLLKFFGLARNTLRRPLVSDRS